MKEDLSRSKKKLRPLWRELEKNKRRKMNKRGEELKERSMKLSRRKSEPSTN